MQSMFKYIIFLFFLIGCSKTNNNSQGNQTDKINNTEVENSDSISYSNDSTIKILKHPILIGDTKIYVKTSESKSAIPIRYFNMHDNENTSVDAALSILTKYGGKIIEFDAQKTREIKFNLNDNSYSIDPNRIYTESGIKYTLNYYNNFSESAFNAVNKFQNEIIQNFLSDSNQILVALHNNTNGNYSIESYLKGEENDKDASEVKISKDWDPDDFYFVTDELIYKELIKYNVNIALQNNKTVTDDGSFSVYCRNKSINYVNVEAQHHHLQEQIKMLEILNKVFMDTYKK